MHDESGFAEYLAGQRKRRHLSQRQLGERAGVPHLTISEIERGVRQPSAAVLRRVAPVLRVPVAELLHRAGYLDAAPGASDEAPPDLRALLEEALALVKEHQAADAHPEAVLAMVDEAVAAAWEETRSAFRGFRGGEMTEERYEQILLGEFRDAVRQELRARLRRPPEER